MSNLNSETIETMPDITDVAVKASPRISIKRKSPLQDLIAKVYRPAVRQATVVLFDQGFCSIANFLTGVLVARACSKEEYGYYVLGFTLLTTWEGIQTSLSGTPFTVFSPSLGKKERRLYLGSTLVQHLTASAVASVGFIIAAALVAGTGHTDGFAGVLFALAIASVFIVLRDFMRYVLLAQLRVWSSLIMGLAANLTTVGILSWAYTGAWLTAPSAYVILAVSSALPVLFLLLSERRQIAVTKNSILKHIKENLRFGKWLVGRTIVFFFAVQIYPWILLLFKGSVATSIYGVCAGLAATINPLFIGLNRFLGPRMAHAACSGVSRVHREVYLVMVLLAGPLLIIFLCAVFFGEWIILIAYGGKYSGIGNIFSIYFLSMIISAEGGIADAGLNALRRPDVTFRSRLIALLMTVSLGLFLVYKLGPLGAAVGVCVSTALAIGYQLMKFQFLKSPIGGSCNSIFSKI